MGGSCEAVDAGGDGGSGCTTDNECASGMVCVGGACEPLDGGDDAGDAGDGGVQYCRLDADCAAGQVCSAGVCTLDQ